MKNSKQKRTYISRLAKALFKPGAITWEGFDLLADARAESRFEQTEIRLNNILAKPSNQRAEILALEHPTDLDTMYHVLLQRIHGEDVIILFPGDRIEFVPKQKVIHTEGNRQKRVQFIVEYMG